MESIKHAENDSSNYWQEHNREPLWKNACRLDAVQFSQASSAFMKEKTKTITIRYNLNQPKCTHEWFLINLIFRTNRAHGHSE